MSVLRLSQVLSFDPLDGHPDSRIIGIDHYIVRCMDGQIRRWKSYTLAAVDEAAQDNVYKRWYAVDLPDLGMSFVRAVKQTDMPAQKKLEPKLSGTAEVVTQGDGEQGTGKSFLETYWDAAGQMWAQEAFVEPESVLYFKTNALKGPVCVVG